MDREEKRSGVGSCGGSKVGSEVVGGGMRFGEGLEVGVALLIVCTADFFALGRRGRGILV